MTSIEKINLHKSSPTTLIVGGANNVGIEIANTLIANDGFVILIDEFSDKIIQKLSNLSTSDYFIFLDKSSLSEISTSFSRLDYIFYLAEDSVIDPSKIISSDYFLQASNSLNTILKLAVKFKSKFELITSILSHQHLLAYKLKNTAYSGLNAMNYTYYEVQRYLESLVFEYFKKSNLDMRIVRLAQIVGNGVDLAINTQVSEFIKKAVLSQKLIIEGDGLNANYLVNLKDAVAGVVKAMFAKKTTGKIISISNSDSITTLALSYKIGEIEKNSVGVEFHEDDSQNELIELTDVTQHWELLNWKPKISIERSLAQTIDEAYKYFGFVATDVKNSNAAETKIKLETPQDSNFKVSEIKTSNSQNKKIETTNLFKKNSKTETNDLKIETKTSSKSIYQDHTLDLKTIKDPVVNFASLDLDLKTNSSKESYVYGQEIRQANLSRIISGNEKKNENKVVNVAKVKKIPFWKRIGISTIVFGLLFLISSSILSIFLILPITQVYRKVTDLTSTLNSSTQTSLLTEQIGNLQSLVDSQNTITKPIITKIFSSKIDSFVQLNYFLKLYSNYETLLTGSKSISYNSELGRIEFFDQNNQLQNSFSANYSDYLLLKNTLQGVKSDDPAIQQFLNNRLQNIAKFTN